MSNLILAYLSFSLGMIIPTIFFGYKYKNLLPKINLFKNPVNSFDYKKTVSTVLAASMLVGFGTLAFTNTIPVIAYSDGTTVDPTFNSGSGLGQYQNIFDSKIQSDGKIIIAGSFSIYNGTQRNSIARLNMDGTLDTTFIVGTGFQSDYGGNGYIDTIVIQSDGKILVGGQYLTYNGVARNGIARLNPNGSLDTTFDPGLGISLYGMVQDISIQSDGKIILAGNFNSYNGIAAANIVRVNSDGSIDTTFNSAVIGTNGGNITDTHTQPSGKIVVVGNFYNSSNGFQAIARLNSDGSFDPTFNPGVFNPNNITGRSFGGEGYDGGLANVITPQSDGKLLIGGRFTRYNGIPAGRFAARLNEDGSLDTTFNANFTGCYSCDVYDIVIQGDNKILVGGQFDGINGLGYASIARLNMDGTTDTTFNPGTGAIGGVYDISIQNDQKIVLGGGIVSYNGVTYNKILRLDYVAPIVPVAFEDNKTTPVGTAITFDPKSNDTLPAGSTITKIDTTPVVVGTPITVPGGTVTVNTDGTVTVTPTSGSTAPIVFVYEVTTPNGTKVTATSTVTQAPDTTAPPAPIVTSPLTGTVTTNPLPVFAGTGEPGSTIVVKDENGNLICTTTVDTQSNWTCTAIFAQSEGGHTYKVTQGDAAGNVSPDSLPVFLTFDIDTDTALLPIENAAPNNGDGNGDGVLDSSQGNVASKLDTANNNLYATLDAGNEGCTSISDYDFTPEAPLPTQDVNYDYPIGLFKFTIKCATPGQSVNVTFILDKLYNTTNWTYRKYNQNTQQYNNLPGVTYGTRVIAGNTVTTISFSAQDGGPLDEDGLANGEYTDPSGPSITNTPSTATNNGGTITITTGTSTQSSTSSVSSQSSISSSSSQSSTTSSANSVASPIKAEIQANTEEKQVQVTGNTIRTGGLSSSNSLLGFVLIVMGAMLLTTLQKESEE